MQRRWPFVAGILVVAVSLVLVFRSVGFGAKVAEPRPVPDGDQEIAWLHVPTSGDTWENFVWGMKRAEMSTAPGGLRVDDSRAFPSRTTAVPEVVLSRDGFAGKVRVRWYKVTNDATNAAWVRALAARNPVPLAVVGGWSSDRARELADAMAATTWPGQKPVLLLSTATADVVDPEDQSADPHTQSNLIELYERSYRFCFTNKQMAAAVTDFVFTDPTLRPGPAIWPELRAAAGAAGGTWGFPWLAGHTPPALPIQAFAVEWRDDPYSKDLSQQLREAFVDQGGSAGRARLEFAALRVPFSAGRFARPNPFEARIVDDILAHPKFPQRGDRTVLVIPSVTAPARRVLGAIVQGTPGAARRLVAVTGDGIPVNALFRDGEFAWPVRALPIPLVLFTHTDPFDWDEPGDPRAPQGYELVPPTRPGEVKNSTEDIQLFTLLTRVVARGAFPDGTDRLIDGPDALVTRFLTLDPPFFEDGPRKEEPPRNSRNRRSGSGEHVVVLRPTPRVEGTVTFPDAVLEVWTRKPGAAWERIRSRPVVQTVRPNDWGVGE